MPRLFAELRSLIDRHRVTGRFLLLGSAYPLLMQHTADSLAGRIGYLTLYPLSYRELGQEASMLLPHWWRGGFPDAWMAPTDQLSVRWREDFIRTYVERDLQILGLTADPVRFRTFLQMLAAVHGQLWNAESLGRSIGVSGNTIRNYLGYLERSFFITVLHPFYKNLGKRLVKSPKIYVQDSGLLHTLLGISDQDGLLLHPHAGSSWEGYVLMEILRQLPEGIQAHFFRTADGTECDLLLTRGLAPVACMEIKLGQVARPTKGFYNTIELLGTKHNYLITWGGDTYALRPDVMVYSFDAFMQAWPELSAGW
jgi:predicted AAA+ superfamily ATPase